MTARLSVLRAGRLLPPGRFLVLIFVRGWVDPRASVRLEGLGKLKKCTSSGTRTGDLPACSIVPQPTTLPRAPFLLVVQTFITNGALETGLWPSSVGGMQLVKFSFLAFVSKYLMRLELQITISVKSTLNPVTNQGAECQMPFQFGIWDGRSNAKRLLQTRNYSYQVRLFTFHTFFFSMALQPLWALAAYFSFLIYSRAVGLLERVISSSQGLYLNTRQHKHRKMHTQH
jgi:hypothetical protein